MSTDREDAMPLTDRELLVKLAGMLRQRPGGWASDIGDMIDAHLKEPAQDERKALADECHRLCDALCSVYHKQGSEFSHHGMREAVALKELFRSALGRLATLPQPAAVPISQAVSEVFHKYARANDFGLLRLTCYEPVFHYIAAELARVHREGKT